MFSAATKGGAVNKYPNASVSATGTAGNTNNLTTYTFTAVSIGAADTNRIVAVVVQTQATLSSVTIAGISCTIIGSTSNYIAYANVPTGTTADIVVTHTGSTSRCYVNTYRIIPGASLTPYFSINDSTDNLTSSSVSVPSGGVAVIATTNTTNNTAITGTWSGSDTPTMIGANRSSANYYWYFGAFLTPFASTYAGTYTTTLVSKKVIVCWQ